MTGTAIISRCRYYRYRLTRVLSYSPGRVVFVMLNPSSAVADMDDPTVRRCKGFAVGWGMGRLDIINLFSFRSHDPDRLLQSCNTPQGPDHWKHIAATLTGADLVVYGWGGHRAADLGTVTLLDHLVRGIGHVPLCLGVTNSGAPKHPLYLKSTTELQVYELPTMG